MKFKKNNMKLTLLFFLLSFTAIAQTNPPPVISTNVPAVTRKNWESVARALPAEWATSVDPIDFGRLTQQSSPDYLKDPAGSLQIRVLASGGAELTAPVRVGLEIKGVAEVWRFSGNSDFSLRADAVRLDKGRLAVAHGFIPPDLRTEELMATFTLDEFRQMAWAREVYFKVGGYSYEIPAEKRLKWKLLWNYYDLGRKVAEGK